MVKKLSIVLGGITIFLVLAGFLLDFIIYQNDLRSHQEYIMGTGVLVPLVECGIIGVMLFLIINNLWFVGGTGMVLLGLFHILVGVGMFAEISSMLANGPEPYLLLFFVTPQNLITGLLLIIGGILAILAGLKRQGLAEKKGSTPSRQFNNPDSKA